MIPSRPDTIYISFGLALPTSTESTQTLVPLLFHIQLTVNGFQQMVLSSRYKRAPYTRSYGVKFPDRPIPVQQPHAMDERPKKQGDRKARKKSVCQSPD